MNVRGDGPEGAALHIALRAPVKARKQLPRGGVDLEGEMSDGGARSANGRGSRGYGTPPAVAARTSADPVSVPDR